MSLNERNTMSLLRHQAYQHFVDSERTESSLDQRPKPSSFSHGFLKNQYCNNTIGLCIAQLLLITPSNQFHLSSMHRKRSHRYDIPTDFVKAGSWIGSQLVKRE